MDSSLLYGYSTLLYPTQGGAVRDAGGAVYNIAHPSFGGNPSLADNGPAIQEAMEAALAGPPGGIVHIPAGTWNIATTPQAGPGFGIEIRGAGRNATTLIAAPSMSSVTVGGITCPTGLVLGSEAPVTLRNMTVDSGSLAAIGTLATSHGLTSGTPITSLTLAANMVAPQTAIIFGVSYTSGGSTITVANNAPGWINGMTITSNVAGIPANTTITSGAGTNTLSISPTTFTATAAGTATITGTTNNTTGGALAGGVVTVANPTYVSTGGTSGHAQQFVINPPTPGTSISNTNVIPVFYDWPNFSFPAGSTVYAPVSQGAGQGFTYANPTGSFFGTGNGTQPDLAAWLDNVAFQNLNATQYVNFNGGFPQQYTFMLIDTGSSFAPEHYLIENCVVGPNTNPNQDSWTTNAERRTVVRNLTMRNHYRSGGVFTAKSADVDIFIENPIPGANSTGNNPNRMLYLGESNCDADIRVRRLEMWDRYAVGGNVCVGTRAFQASGISLPGGESIVIGVTGAVTSTGAAGTIVATVAGSPGGGTFKLTDGTNISTTIAPTASAATVQTALASLAGGVITVTGSSGGPWTLSVPAGEGLTITANALTGGSSPTVNITAGTANSTLITLPYAPPVSLSAMATAGAPVHFTNIQDGASGAGTWQHMNVNPNLTVVNQVSTTSFTVAYNSSAITTGVKLNANPGGPGPGNLSWARFGMGTSNLQLCFSNDKVGATQYLADGYFGSGVTVTNESGGFGPEHLALSGRFGSFYNSGSQGPFVVSTSSSMGSMHVKGRFDLCGSNALVTSSYGTGLDLVATGSAYNTGTAPTLVSAGTVLNPTFSSVEGILPVTGTCTLSSGAHTVSNSQITSASLIRLTYQTVGGTPGAVYVSARSAGTSFTITSTSGSDSSVIFYEILSY